MPDLRSIGSDSCRHGSGPKAPAGVDELPTLLVPYKSVRVPLHFSQPRAQSGALGRPAPPRFDWCQRGVRVYSDAEADMVSAEASTAICVQRFDDSRNSAIHTTYRISLRSSSLREPRYPLLRVVSVRCRALGAASLCFRILIGWVCIQVADQGQNAPSPVGPRPGRWLSLAAEPGVLIKFACGCGWIQ